MTNPLDFPPKRVDLSGELLFLTEEYRRYIDSKYNPSLFFEEWFEQVYPLRFT